MSEYVGRTPEWREQLSNLPNGSIQPATVAGLLDAHDDRIAELTEQLHKSQAEVYRLMQVNQDLREWWSSNSSAMRDKRREHLMRST